MSDTSNATLSASALGIAHQIVDELLGLDLGSDTDDELLASYRELERLSCRLAAVGHAFIAQVEARSLAFEAGAKSTSAFLRQLLRLHPGEAKARVAAAAAAGPRRTLTGEALDPIYTQVAIAQRGGSISPRHAAIVVKCVETLPDEAQAEHGVQVEADLVGHAAKFDPHELAKLAQRMHDCLDPDGRLRDSAYREKCRDVTLRQRPDGSAALGGELTAECAERLLTVFDALAAPKAETDGQKDPRTAAQRRHDALTALPLNGALPTVGGVATTVIVTMTEQAYRTGRGVATTGHGAVVPAADALAWAGGDQRLFGAVFNGLGAVVAHSGMHRLYREPQRLALVARDRGCCFPGCDTPPALTQIHHIREWANGGRTTLDHAAMLCGYHHRHFSQLGWICKIIDGRPAWIPPPHIDPDREPRYNRMHVANAP